MTRKFLFALALSVGLLIGLKFIWKPSSSSLTPLPNAQTDNQQPITYSTPSPSPILSSPKFSRIMIDNQELSVELATTFEEKSQGLSSRDGIGSDGMLFIMDPTQLAVFWMKDMRFPIDILWIKDEKVSGFIENAPIPTADTQDNELPSYSSKTPVDAVLELPAGYIKQFGIKAGSVFTIL